MTRMSSPQIRKCSSWWAGLAAGIGYPNRIIIICFPKLPDRYTISVRSKLMESNGILGGVHRIAQYDFLIGAFCVEILHP